MSKVFEASISHNVVCFLSNIVQKKISWNEINQVVFNDFGIVQFLEVAEELNQLKRELAVLSIGGEEPDRGEYGDFQTNQALADKGVQHLIKQGVSPQIVIEPTCGKGNFIIASLRGFETTEIIIGVELYKPYIWETKFNIIDFFLTNTVARDHKPSIYIEHESVFDYDFKEISRKYAEKDILILGNPPWVTNAKLGSLNSLNLPKKANFKNHTGLDAMTGKGNFDIGESITLMMFDAFQMRKGHLFLIVKNAVIKNIVFEQYSRKYQIGSIQKYRIDSKKEFNVSVEASFVFVKMNDVPSLLCEEFDFEKSLTSENGLVSENQFGWLQDKFVANLSSYLATQQLDGLCPFVWRQGLKHDCSSIMELEKTPSHYLNALNQEICLEPDLVYGLLKSSDLKNTVISHTRKYTIVTQQRVGQETNYIKESYPQTYHYLMNNLASFEARKSSIYRNKPAFSIFGIGDYSFKPFKVAISGLYKTFHFTLILPQEGKPVMLDDTCYLIGFDCLEYAAYASILLNAEITKQLLGSITFSDAKRTFTKEVLMRIDLCKVAQMLSEEYLKNALNGLNSTYQLSLNLDQWDAFLLIMNPVSNNQLVMFA